MSVTLLRAAARHSVAWRNGGGVTREIAVSPAGATMADFDWRVSMAEVAVAGPFSLFPGVDRVLTVVAGTLLLAVAGQAPVRLAPDSAPYRFAGDVACSGTPVDGAVVDLNVMVRRGRVGCDVRRVAGGRVALEGALHVFVALAAGPAALGGDVHDLGVHDALMIAGGGTLACPHGVVIAVG